MSINPLGTADAAAFLVGPAPLPESPLLTGAVAQTAPTKQTLARLQRFGQGLTIAQGHVETSADAEYDLDDVEITSVDFAGLRTTTAFTASSVTWTAGGQSTTVP